MAAYYNENDPFAAAWLRNLVAAGLIAAGDVDERDIADVGPGDLAGYTQCHFFAGIGGWSYALRLAGWPDDRPVWTGSCPCQPFSAAGSGKAADDRRHLWPQWLPLISECRPAVVFGEQVEAAIGWGWLDVVFADLEAAGYACGASVLPACSVGAPHIRNRVWFVADADGGKSGYGGLQLRGQHRFQPPDGGADNMADAMPAGRAQRRPQSGHRPPAECSTVGVVGHADCAGRAARDRLAGGSGARSGQSPRPGDERMAHAAGARSVPAGQGAEGEARHEARLRRSERGCPDDGLAVPVHAQRGPLDGDGQDGCDGQNRGRQEAHGEPGTRREVFDMADAESDGRRTRRTGGTGRRNAWAGADGLRPAVAVGDADSPEQQEHRRAQPMGTQFAGARCAGRRPWDRSVLIRCADGNWRSVPAGETGHLEPALFPLAHGIPNRVGTLRGAGNAIVPQIAAEFIRAVQP